MYAQSSALSVVNGALLVC